MRLKSTKIQIKMHTLEFDNLCEKGVMPDGKIRGFQGSRQSLLLQ